MENINITIDCPDCGSVNYIAKEFSNDKNCKLVIGKCSTGGCDLTVEYFDEVFEHHYESFEELKDYVYQKFTLLDKEDCGCSS